ncbi:MAG: DUF4229 domain-containing protein [Nonomuraea sp.]|nr:DUF4229 domain-containing protein [Nonomuraea sp.]
MRPVLVYSLSRITLFVVTLGVLALLGARNLLLILLSLVISGIASYVLLSKQRDALSARISNKVQPPESSSD